MQSFAEINRQTELYLKEKARLTDTYNLLAVDSKSMEAQIVNTSPMTFDDAKILSNKLGKEGSYHDILIPIFIIEDLADYGSQFKMKLCNVKQGISASTKKQDIKVVKF